MMPQYAVIDYVILAVVVISVITGLSRGFVRELFAIGLWVLAIWGAAQYSGMVSTMIKPWVSQAELRSLLSFVAILLLILVCGGLITTTLSFLILKTGLSGTDRVLGMVFGLIRAVFVIALFLVVIQLSGFKFDQYRQGSKLLGQFTPVVSWISSWIPSWMQKIKSFDHIDHQMVFATETQQHVVERQLKDLTAHANSHL